MVCLLNEIRKRAFLISCRIGLVDGEDERVIKGACYVKQNSLIEPILIGSREKIIKKMELLNVPPLLEIYDPSYNVNNLRYTELYIQSQLNKGKRITVEMKIEEKLKTPTYFAAMLLKTGELDGVVGGASYTTAEILKAGLDIIGLSDNSQVVSGSFVMILKNIQPGGQQVFVFSDCAVIPDPDSKQLVSIALNAVKVARKVVGMEPRVALLSFSTLGSARHSVLDKIKEAKEQLIRQIPQLIVDGEIQADAAIIPEVAKIKASQSPLEGRANVLIFPDLNSGNIAYKLVERMAGAKAIGVILEGFNKPLNDLSRGCSTDDIINMICITALQSISNNKDEVGVESG